MFFNIFLLFLTPNLCHGDSIFENLYKSDESSRATACTLSRNNSACVGLLWRQTWMLTRASCVLDYPLSSIYIKKGVVNCTHELNTIATIAKGELCNRNVVARHKHPQYPKVDLAFLRLDWPYATELIDNRTISENTITKLDDWMNNILFNGSIKNIKAVSYKKYQMYSTPVKMFLVTVVLPSTSFILFFLFVVFFTGRKNNRIPYRNLTSDKKQTTYV